MNFACADYRLSIHDSLACKIISHKSDNLSMIVWPARLYLPSQICSVLQHLWLSVFVSHPVLQVCSSDGQKHITQHIKQKNNTLDLYNTVTTAVVLVTFLWQMIVFYCKDSFKLTYSKWYISTMVNMLPGHP